MTDAELIYNACLRAEKRFEDVLRAMSRSEQKTATHLHTSLSVIRTLREEIGNGINDAYPR